MVAFKNFEASVHVDGTALVEYEGDEDDNGVNETNTTNTVTRYIEAIAGKAFVIKYAVRSGLDVLKDCDALRWTLVIDGKLIKHGIWSRTMLQTSPSFCQRSDTSIQNEDESGWTEREFTFGNINLREFLILQRSSISLTVYRRRRAGRSTRYCQRALQAYR